MAPKKRSSIKRRLALDSDDDDVPPLAPDSDVEFDEGHGPAAKAPPPRRAIVPASSSSASAPVVPAPPPEGVGRAERRSTIRRRLKAGEEGTGIVPAATGVGAVVASAPQAGDLPFNALLKRKWCLGQKSSADVQEEAAAAAAQSAVGLERLAGINPHQPGHMQRALISASGWPRGAPEFFILPYLN